MPCRSYEAWWKVFLTRMWKCCCVSECESSVFWSIAIPLPARLPCCPCHWLLTPALLLPVPPLNHTTHLNSPSKWIGRGKHNVLCCSSQAPWKYIFIPCTRQHVALSLKLWYNLFSGKKSFLPTMNYSHLDNATVSSICTDLVNYLMLYYLLLFVLIISCVTLSSSKPCELNRE